MADTLWWLARWTRPYLLLRESRYESANDQLSMLLMESFGEGSSQVGPIVDALLDGAIQGLVVWNADVHVVRHAVNLLDALTERSVVQTQLLQGQAVWRLAEGFRDSSSAVRLLFVFVHLCRCIYRKHGH